MIRHAAALALARQLLSRPLPPGTIPPETFLEAMARIIELRVSIDERMQMCERIAALHKEWKEK